MKSGTVIFEKVKIRFCLWELLHTIEFSYNEGSKRFIYFFKNMTLLNNVEQVSRHMVGIKNDYFDKDRLDDIVGEIIIEHDDDNNRI